MVQQKGQSKKRRRTRKQRERDDIDQQLVEVRRVARMQAGGRRFGFRCFVVVGDRNGRVGIGIGKGNDVSSGVDKAVRRAKKAMMTAPVVEGTIPFALEGTYQTSRVLLKPAAEGRGIIAGGVVRTICELAGIPNITTKTLSRTKNVINTARATIAGLHTIARLAERKGIELESKTMTHNDDDVTQES